MSGLGQPEAPQPLPCPCTTPPACPPRPRRCLQDAAVRQLSVAAWTIHVVEPREGLHRAFQILVGGGGDLLVLQLPETSLGGKSPGLPTEHTPLWSRLPLSPRSPCPPSGAPSSALVPKLPESRAHSLLRVKCGSTETKSRPPAFSPVYLKSVAPSPFGMKGCCWKSLRRVWISFPYEVTCSYVPEG